MSKIWTNYIKGRESIFAFFDLLTIYLEIGTTKSIRRTLFIMAHKSKYI